MAKVVPPERALRYFVFMALAVVALGVGERWSSHLFASASVGAKWLGVAIAVGAPVPWIVLSIIGISNLDEFQRHVTLVGTALAFIIALLLRTGFYAMQDARLISPFATFPDLVATLALWCLGVGVAGLYYRARA